MVNLGLKLLQLLCKLGALHQLGAFGWIREMCKCNIFQDVLAVDRILLDGLLQGSEVVLQLLSGVRGQSEPAQNLFQIFNVLNREQCFGV